MFEHEDLPHYLSLGAGVQSSTLALMYARGEIGPMPKAAIFADTRAEPQSVYDYLSWLESVLPFPVHRVQASQPLAVYELSMAKRKRDGATYRRNVIPWWSKNEDGTTGRLNRGCTRDFKITPILRWMKQDLMVQPATDEVWGVTAIGISLDEMKRMKPSREGWCVHRWPLIERRITRQQCLEWMEANGHPKPPRSSCVFCPFHSPKEWRRLQLEEPDEFAKAVEYEKQLQAAAANDEVIRSVPYLHRSCKPLDEIDFRTDVERGQQLLWDDECEGMCGV